MTLVCGQPPSLGSMSRGWRWAVFVVGMVETMLWSGTIFGWASLVHVLKLQSVYYNLCPQDPVLSPDVNGTQETQNKTTFSSLHNKVSPFSVCYKYSMFTI